MRDRTNEGSRIISGSIVRVNDVVDLYIGQGCYAIMGANPGIVTASELLGLGLGQEAPDEQLDIIRTVVASGCDPDTFHAHIARYDRNGRDIADRLFPKHPLDAPERVHGVVADLSDGKVLLSDASGHPYAQKIYVNDTAVDRVRRYVPQDQYAEAFLTTLFLGPRMFQAIGEGIRKAV